MLVKGIGGGGGVWSLLYSVCRTIVSGLRTITNILQSRLCRLDRVSPVIYGSNSLCFTVWPAVPYPVPVPVQSKQTTNLHLHCRSCWWAAPAGTDRNSGANVVHVNIKPGAKLKWSADTGRWSNLSHWLIGAPMNMENFIFALKLSTAQHCTADCTTIWLSLQYLGLGWVGWLNIAQCCRRVKLSDWSREISLGKWWLGTILSTLTVYR